MKEKLIEAKNEFARQVKKLSISVTLTAHLLYIGYLAYALTHNIGIRGVNIALMIGTAVFLAAYLLLQLVGQNKKSRLKSTKRFYKRFKLATKVFSTGTAIYSLVTAAKSVSPFAMILSTLGAVFLAIRIITELLVSLIERKARRIKESIKNKWESKKKKKSIKEADFSDCACAISENDFE